MATVFPQTVLAKDDGTTYDLSGLASGATGAVKAEDAAHASGDFGIMALAVRQDANAALAGTTGDYIPLTTSALGSLKTVAGEIYPAAATALIAGSGNVANAAAAATLTGTATTTVYIAGFEMTASGATAGLPVLLTITGLLGGTRTYIFTFPTGVLVGEQLVVKFDPPLPASAINTAIVVSCPAGGAGNTNAAMVAHGFYI